MKFLVFFLSADAVLIDPASPKGFAVASPSSSTTSVFAKATPRQDAEMLTQKNKMGKGRREMLSRKSKRPQLFHLLLNLLQGSINGETLSLILVRERIADYVPWLPLTFGSLLVFQHVLRAEIRARKIAIKEHMSVVHVYIEKDDLTLCVVIASINRALWFLHVSFLPNIIIYNTIPIAKSSTDFMLPLLYYVNVHKVFMTLFLNMCLYCASNAGENQRSQ